MAHSILSLALTLTAALAFAQDGATCQYGDFLFHKSGAGMEICGYTGADTDVILPEYVDDGFGRNAVVFPDSVAGIPWMVLGEARNVETVVLGRGVRSIGPGFLTGDYDVKEIYIMSPEPPELLSADSECGRFGPFHHMSMPDVYVPAESLGMYAVRPSDRHSMHCDWESQGSWDYFYR